MLKLHFCGIEMKNPITTASGTFAYGKEFSSLYDCSILGAITVKGISAKPWMGNPQPRIAEIWGGVMNSVGLENQGADYFKTHDLPRLNKIGCPIIVNIWGQSKREYQEVCEILRDSPFDFLEANISCPNLEQGGLSFGSDPHTVYDIVSMLKKVSNKKLIVKLTPNVSDISEIAKAAQAAGADALSLINTVLGMKIDLLTKKPYFHKKVAGMSGPCIKPIAIKMVYEAYRSVSIPIIGMGGVINAEDVIEFMLAGATMVAVGSANFYDPYVCPKIIDQLSEYCKKEKIQQISDIIGMAHVKQ